MSLTETESKFLPTPQICARYGISARTIARWVRDPDLQFPRPLVINGRKFYSESALTAFDRAQVAQRA